MNIKPSRSDVVNLLKGEYKNSDGFGKLFIFGLFFNIPIIGFIPYLTQALTVIILAIFLKKYLLLAQRDATTDERINLPLPHASKIIIAITIGTMFFQILWIPYISQLVTLVLLAILYAVFSKYK